MKTKTLFVLGAGASAPYGFPLGDKLSTKIAQLLPARATQIEAPSSWDDDYSEAREFAAMLSTRILGSRTPTIDAFLQSFSNREPIIDAMLSVIRDCEENALVRMQRPSEVKDDWISWLFHNRLTTQPKQFRNNEIAFLTFNYDRIPELQMATMMAHLHDIEAGYALSMIRSPLMNGLDRFIHMHGRLNAVARCSPANNDASKYRLKISKMPTRLECPAGIVTMYDEKEIEYRKEISTTYFEWADRIIFLGIAYHTEVLDTLPYAYESLSNSGFATEVIFCGGTAYGLPDHERQRVSNWGTLNFVLGDNDQDCTQFLSKHLSRD